MGAPDYTKLDCGDDPTSKIIVKEEEILRQERVEEPGEIRDQREREKRRGREE